jgi:SulP family sulfate permease
MAFFFRPKLFDSLKGYTREQLGTDVAAGITVGVVALPLAMAFAIASGLKPEAGLFTAIIAGFIISALGGSKVQIGGPAGAFIVIVYGILERYGLPNLILATAASGVLLFIMGLLKLGTLIWFYQWHCGTHHGVASQRFSGPPSQEHAGRFFWHFVHLE